MVLNLRIKDDQYYYTRTGGDPSVWNSYNNSYMDALFGFTKFYAYDRETHDRTGIRNSVWFIKSYKFSYKDVVYAHYGE